MASYFAARVQRSLPLKTLEEYLDKGLHSSRHSMMDS